jgi:glycosyltransferase involved in cell wall biosynthesis
VVSLPDELFDSAAYLDDALSASSGAGAELCLPVKSNGLTDKRMHIAFVNSTREDLAESDVFLLPSMSEGMPDALLEAIAAELIPVARNIGSVREIWPDSLKELMLPTESRVEAVRQAMDKLLGMDRARLEELKEISLAICRSTFNLSEKVGEFERWRCDEVIGG